MMLREGDLVREKKSASRLNDQQVMIVTAGPHVVVHAGDKSGGHELLVVEVLSSLGPLLIPVDSLERVSKGKRD